MSSGPDLGRAVELAVAAALEPLEGEPPDLLAVFVCGADPHQIDALVPGVLDATGARHSLGCTASGVAGAGNARETGLAVSAWAAVLPGLSLRAFHLEVMKVEAGVAVIGLPEPLTDEGTALLLADAFSFPTSSFLGQLDARSPGLAVVGGLAAGMQGPGSTRLIIDGRLFDRGAVGLLLGGSDDVDSGDADGGDADSESGTGAADLVCPVVSQGCRPVGPDMTVTRAEDNVLLELAGVPAPQRLQQLLAGLPEAEQARFHDSPQIGTAVDEYAEERGQGDFVIRPLLGLDLDRPGISIPDPVAVGRTVRFHVLDAEAAGADLRAALYGAGRASGALVFSSARRGQAMFGCSDHDVTTVRDLTGARAVVGAFTGGELGPVAGRNHLHGFSASALLFR